MYNITFSVMFYLCFFFLLSLMVSNIDPYIGCVDDFTYCPYYCRYHKQPETLHKKQHSESSPKENAGNCHIINSPYFSGEKCYYRRQKDYFETVYHIEGSKKLCSENIPENRLRLQRYGEMCLGIYEGIDCIE